MKNENNNNQKDVFFNYFYYKFKNTSLNKYQITFIQIIIKRMFKN